MTDKKIKEGLGDMAHMAEKDHEVQMARADLYKIAKYSIKLHEMLKSVSEAEGLEGWVQSKITKAADYLGSVYHHLDYEQATGEIGESNSTNKIALLESTEFLAMPDHLVDVYLESLTIEQLEILEEGVLGAIGRGIKGTAKLAGKGAVGTAKLAGKGAVGGAKLAGKGALGGAKLAAKGAVGGAKLAAKGAVGGAKLAAKGAKSAVVNKQGNLRLSTAGRADGAEAKLAKIQAKKNAKINKAAKLKKDQERLAKAKAGITQAKNKPAPVGEGKSPHKKGTKKYKKHMAAMHAESVNDPYKQRLHAKLAERSLTKDESKKKKST